MRRQKIWAFVKLTRPMFLIGAVLLEQNDEWQLQHRYMQVEAMAELFSPANEQRQLPSAA